MRAVIKTLEARERHFTIIKHESGMYCAIEDKYITNGVLNTTLNGLQMHANSELEECIKDTLNCVEVEYLMTKGYSKVQAVCEVLNIPITEY